MGVPAHYIDFTQRISRFISKDANEAINPGVTQVEANFNATEDNSVTPVDYYIQPAPGLIYEIHRIMVRVKATQNISSDEYTNGGPLSTGIIYQLERNGVKSNVTPIPVRSIGDYSSYAGVDVHPLENPSKSWIIRFSFFKAGAPIYLKGDSQDKLMATLNDDFTSLDFHTGLVQGVLYNEDGKIKP